MSILSAPILIAAGLALAGPAPMPDGRPAPLPISAHNCYPQGGQGGDRLAEALALGIDNIEIDLTWDAEGRRLLVGHDARPRPGVAYPEFETYLVPALEAHWREPRLDGAPTVLTIDWKTADPEAVARFKAFLDTHPDWFSSAPKADASPLTTRRLTVCLTGDDAAKAHYDALIPPGGTYRAFRDKVSGAGMAPLADPAAYASEPASAFHRFLTVYWGHVERGGPPLAGDWTEAEAARLKALVDHAHAQGYRLRVYTLNGRSGTYPNSYRFLDPATARVRWRASVSAGVDWTASDEYDEIARDVAEILASPAGPDPNP